LTALWQGAAGASLAANEAVPIGMTASAKTTVGDYAEPVQFSGAWIGQVGGANIAYGSFGMRGSARGMRP
jgi:hypothetical protein